MTLHVFCCYSSQQDKLLVQVDCPEGSNIQWDKYLQHLGYHQMVAVGQNHCGRKNQHHIVLWLMSH